MEKPVIRLPLEGADNTRDLGGYVGENSKVGKFGVFLRSNSLCFLTQNDNEYLKNYGVTLSAQRQLHRQGGYLFYPGRCRVLRGRPEKGGQGLPGQRMVGKGSHTQRGLLRQVQLRQNY